MRYRIPLLLGALLLAACAPRAPLGSCYAVGCRPQSDGRQLAIWWQPDLRTGPADYSLVTIHE